MVIALDEFRKIMSKPKPVEGNDTSENPVNPLLRGADIPESMRGDQVVTPDQTIFAQFDQKIEEALEYSKNLDRAALDEF